MEYTGQLGWWTGPGRPRMVLGRMCRVLLQRAPFSLHCKINPTPPLPRVYQRGCLGGNGKESSEKLSSLNLQGHLGIIWMRIGHFRQREQQMPSQKWERLSRARDWKGRGDGMGGWLTETGRGHGEWPPETIVSWVAGYPSLQSKGCKGGVLPSQILCTDFQEAPFLHIKGYLSPILLCPRRISENSFYLVTFW